MRIWGTIRTIGLHTVPSKFQGRPGKAVSRVILDIEGGEGDGGGALDTRDLVGLPFQGPPELASRFEAGQRVRIETTTPSGMHIARIDGLGGDQ